MITMIIIIIKIIAITIAIIVVIIIITNIWDNSKSLQNIPIPFITLT